VVVVGGSVEVFEEVVVVLSFNFDDDGEEGMMVDEEDICFLGLFFYFNLKIKASRVDYTLLCMYQ
jgi:hypothetical protein